MRFYDLGQLPSSSDSPSSNAQELLDLLEISHSPQRQLTMTVSNDAERFKESLFFPFAIKDAAQVKKQIISYLFIKSSSNDKYNIAVLCFPNEHPRLGSLLELPSHIKELPM